MSKPERLISRYAEQPGLSGALLFALVAERLAQFYDHGQWPNDGRMRQQALDWLQRAKVKIDSPWLRELVSTSGDMASEISASLSREAGLQTAHEMAESLDPNHPSPIGQMMMAQCVAWIDTMNRAEVVTDEDPVR